MLPLILILSAIGFVVIGLIVNHIKDQPLPEPDNPPAITSHEQVNLYQDLIE
jgi:hypothetical protein